MVESSNSIRRIAYTGESSPIQMLFHALRNGFFLINETGDINAKYSEHKWIANIKLIMKNIHELCNIGTRKLWGIEDSNNTEKNPGYNYKRVFSYA